MNIFNLSTARAASASPLHDEARDWLLLLTSGRATVADAKIIRAINKVFNFQPAEIIDQLNLRRPIFSKTTNYGHFGKNDKDLTWEATNQVAALLKAL